MASTTTNFGLTEPTQADTVASFLEAFNGNMDIIDALPIPSASGSNSQLTYQKYADGLIHMFGCIDLGTSYPCGYAIAAGRYSSNAYTLNFPVAFASTAYSFTANVAADINPDMSVAISEKSTSSVKVRFINYVTDSAAPNSKQLSVDLWGRWK